MIGKFQATGIVGNVNSQYWKVFSMLALLEGSILALLPIKYQHYLSNDPYANVGVH